MRSEKFIQRAILDFLEKVPGVVAWKSGGGAFRLTYKGKERFVRMGKRGVSDLIGWRTEYLGNVSRGYGYVARFLAIEVKRPGRPLRPEQEMFLARVKAAGGIVVVAHSVEEVATALGLTSERSDAPLGGDAGRTA